MAPLALYARNVRDRLTPTLALALTATTPFVMVVADDYLGAVGIVLAVTLSPFGPIPLPDRRRPGRPVPVPGGRR